MPEQSPRSEWQRLVDEKLHDHDRRLSEFEKEQAVYRALSEERRKHMDARFNSLELSLAQTKKDLTSDISGVKSSISKVAWLIVSAMILAVVQFGLSGGFKMLSSVSP